MGGITVFSLNNSRITIVVIVVSVLLGIGTFLNMPRFEDPNIVIREAVVFAAFPGMEPRQVEDLITRRLEEKIRTIGEVDEIRSDSKNGVSVIHVELGDDVKNLDATWRDLRNKVSDVVPDLPEGTIGPIVNDEFGEVAVATIAVTGEGFSLPELRDVAFDLRDALGVFPGVKKVELFGVQDEEVLLKFSNAKLAQFGISPRVIAQTLINQNVVLPGGRFDIAGTDAIIEPSGNFQSLEEIREVLIPIPGTGRNIPLIDIVDIERQLKDPPDKPVLFRGEPAVIISVSVHDGVNSVKFGEELTRKIQQLEGQLPIGYALEYATFQPDLVEAAVNGAVSNVYQTLVTVLVVVVLFLGLRTGLIVGAFVPLTILLGVIVMSIVGIDLERVSIAAAIVALGMLVDNGIVVAEDIRVRMEAGGDRREACFAAGRTLAVPLLTSSLTTIFAFLPMVFITGSTGEYIIGLPLVIVILLLASWFLSMYVTPAMSYWFMKVKPRDQAENQSADPYGGGLYRRYRGLLELILRLRIPVVALMFGALLLAGYAFRFVDKSFFPAGDRNQFLAYVDLPLGTRVTKTRQVIEDYVDWLQDPSQNPDVTSTVAYIGSGGPRFFLSLSPLDPDPHLATIIINTETSKQVPAAVERSRQFIANNFPDARGRIKPMWLGSTEPGLVEIRISGPDPSVLFEKGRELEEAFLAIAGSQDVKQDWENLRPKIQVLVDQQRARRAGLTSGEAALSLSAFVDGARVTDYREGDKIIPVLLKSTDEERSTIYNLRDISVYSSTRDQNVPLSQVADFQSVWELGRIKRFDQVRTVAVEGKHPTLKADQLLDGLKPSIEALNLGPEYSWEVGAELEDSAEAQEKLFGNMPLALVGIVVLLIWQFNSFRRPAIILLTIPLSFIGGVAGLLILSQPFSFMAILGVFSLAGIIINNGIVLIDRIDSEIAEGQTPYDAVVIACLARFRPILMTTVTTILGLLPFFISNDPLFVPLATFIAFGLAVGTVLTLGVVPVLYSLFMRVEMPKRA
jgi:multidrug efflux pump subunit AcrB